MPRILEKLLENWSFFRSNTKIENNLKNSNIGNSKEDRKLIINSMWGNYEEYYRNIYI